MFWELSSKDSSYRAEQPSITAGMTQHIKKELGWRGVLKGLAEEAGGEGMIKFYF